MNVPKFGSFRPKPVAVTADKDEDRSRSKRPSRDLKRPDRKNRSRSRERSAAVEPVLPVRGYEREPDIFIVDRKGDVKNLVYGGLHRYDVATYRRIGAGSILGLRRDLKIQRGLSDEKGIVISSFYQANQRKREKYVFSKMEMPRLLKIRPQAHIGDAQSVQSEYIPLTYSHGKKRKRVGDDPDATSDTDEEATDYRSIQGKAKLETVNDPDLQYASDGDSSDFDSGDGLAAARLKNVDLNRKVEEYPEDIAAWIALIEHQENLLHGRHENYRVTNAEMQSTAEIKIHMYEKALENAKTLDERELLLKGLMAEGAKIWETKVQIQKWEQIANENFESLSLWKQYLDFKQTAFSSFQYEEIREIYAKRFLLLTKKISIIPSSSVILSEQLVYVLLRYTLFARESGFSELAIAIWQGILELNFRAPSTYSDWKIDFAEFWESEVARIGEEKSAGWAAFHDSTESVDVVPVKTDEDVGLVPTEGLFRHWVTTERRMQQSTQLPARTLDETVEDDPFRVILFSDIEDFLFVFESAHGLQSCLVDALLLFCYKSPMTPDRSDWVENAFVARVSYSNKTRIPEKIDTQSSEKDQLIQSVFEYPERSFVSGPETYFSSHWFQSLADWKQQPVEGDLIFRDWTRKTLRQLLDSSYRDDLGEFVLALEWRNEPEGIKKIAKGLLKKHSDSLRLYNAYGMIEWARGNKEVASAVFDAAIKMSASMSDEKKADVILLWKSWTWCYLEEGDKDNALKTLLCIPSNTPDPTLQSSPTAIIKSRQYLTSNRDYLLSTNSPSTALIHAELLALLVYLTTTSTDQPQSVNQGNITAYLDSMASFSTTLLQSPHPSHIHERHLQSTTRLFTYHARIGPFRPSLLRSTLTTHLAHFPTNTIFLSLFAWNETRFRIEGRVRALHNTLPNDSLCLTQHLFRIRYELHHGTIHSAKAAFEHALSVTSQVRGNWGMWVFYMFFVARWFAGNGKVKVKEVWYRALRACPWVKEVYMVGFEILCAADDFHHHSSTDNSSASKKNVSQGKNRKATKRENANDEDEKIDVVELMNTWRVLGEKGLRVRVDLEDVFEEM